MSLAGLGTIGSLFVGVLVGFFMALPPGPGITQLLAYAMAGKRKAGWKSAAGIILADLIIILFCLIFYSFISALSENRWVNMVAGAFLIGFAIKNLSGKKMEKGTQSHKPFSFSLKLTLLNPNIWLALVTVAALAFQDVASGLTLMIGIEIGTLAWFAILIQYANRIPDSRHILIQRYAMVFIALVGVYVMTTAMVGSI